MTLFDIPAEPKRPRRTHPARHLETKHDDGIRASWCRTCRAPVLTGLDAETCAFDARVDPTPLTALGEALALLAGLRTYDLRIVGRIPRIRRRNAAAINRRPAGTPSAGFRAADVVAEHRCNTPTADTLTTTPNLQPPATHHVKEPPY